MFKAFACSYPSTNLNEIVSLVNLWPYASYVQSNQYVWCNLQYAQQLGFQRPEDLIYLEYTDILEHCRECITNLGGNLEFEEPYQHFICKADIQTELAKKPKRFEICTLFPTGFVYAIALYNIPILDSRQHIQAMLTVSQDITDRLDLIDIYAFYKEFYQEVKQATYQFLKYFSLESCFDTFPTQQELLALLTFRKDARAKYVARQLSLSDRTVEEYKARLRNKIAPHTSYEQLLLKLRNPFNDSQVTDILC